jgi:hypothetical protein
VPWYRVKLAVKISGNLAESWHRREAVRALIGSHGGKDVSSARPNAKFVTAVFSKADAAKAFRDDVRQRLQAGYAGAKAWTVLDPQPPRRQR